MNLNELINDPATQFLGGFIVLIGSLAGVSIYRLNKKINEETYDPSGNSRWENSIKEHDKRYSYIFEVRE